jgi:hypothetical protein
MQKIQNAFYLGMVLGWILGIIVFGGHGMVWLIALFTTNAPTTFCDKIGMAGWVLFSWALAICLYFCRDVVEGFRPEPDNVNNHII